MHGLSQRAKETGKRKRGDKKTRTTKNEGEESKIGGSD